MNLIAQAEGHSFMEKIITTVVEIFQRIIHRHEHNQPHQAGA